jgi:hypothetical protein
MIVLFTDFGLHGPYTGQVKAVLHQMAPGVPAIDLFADAPVGNPKASAYLLAVYAAWFPMGTVFLCIVDPGVGGTRPAIVPPSTRMSKAQSCTSSLCWRLERIEVGDAIHAEDYGLAVEDEARLPDLASGLHDPGIAAGPVIAVASEQTHAITVPLYAEAVAIVFYFVQPVGAVRDCRGFGRQAKLKGTAHPCKIGHYVVFR